MKVSTSDLLGPALDWAVAATEGYVKRGAARAYKGSVLIPNASGLGQTYSPSTSWAHGGPIIAAHCVEFDYDEASQTYRAYDGIHAGEGATHLIAAMRCLVAAKLGDEVELPDALAATV